MTPNYRAQNDKLSGHFTVIKMLYLQLTRATEIKNSCAYEKFLIGNYLGSILTEGQLCTFSAHSNED